MGVKPHLHAQADATPKCYRPRPIPLSIKEKVEAELERKEKLGILEKIEIADWAAPIVPVSKPDNGWGLQSNNQSPLGCKPVPTTEKRDLPL